MQMFRFLLLFLSVPLGLTQAHTAECVPAIFSTNDPFVGSRQLLSSQELETVIPQRAIDIWTRSFNTWVDQGASLFMWGETSLWGATWTMVANPLLKEGSPPVVAF